MGSLLERRHAKVDPNGRLVIEGLEPNASLEVVLLREDAATVDPAKYQGLPFRFDAPFDPIVSPDDWDAAR